MEWVEVIVHCFPYRYQVRATFVFLSPIGLTWHFGGKMYESISEISIVYHWSKCLSLCQHYTVLITVALWKILTSVNKSPPTVFFKIILAILRPLHLGKFIELSYLFLQTKPTRMLKKTELNLSVNLERIPS